MTNRYSCPETCISVAKHAAANVAAEIAEL